MIIKTGVDVIEVERIKGNIENHGEAFLNRVFTEKEIEYCEDRNVQKYQSYAGRFAAKEAVFKAISAFLNNKYDIEWKDIEVLNDAKGRPFVNLSKELISKLDGTIKGNLDGKLNCNIDISISHISDIALANVIMQIETN